MITQTFATQEAWEEARLCKITGSKLKDVITKRGSGKKIGFYQLIADRLALPADGEYPMDRGTRLESEAIEMFSKETGKEVNTDLVMWLRDDNENIAISPDGFIGETEAVEVKCLGSARHIEALMTGAIPKDYEDQVIQYFVVNDKLQILYFVFYDPRLVTKQFFYLAVERDQAKVDQYLEIERSILEEVEAAAASLMDF